MTLLNENVINFNNIYECGKSCKDLNVFLLPK